MRLVAAFLSIAIVTSFDAIASVNPFKYHEDELVETIFDRMMKENRNRPLSRKLASSEKKLLANIATVRKRIERLQAEYDQQRRLLKHITARLAEEKSLLRDNKAHFELSLRVRRGWHAPPYQQRLNVAN